MCHVLYSIASSYGVPGQLAELPQAGLGGGAGVGWYLGQGGGLQSLQTGHCHRLFGVR